MDPEALQRRASGTFDLGWAMLGELSEELRSETFTASPWSPLVAVAEPRQVLAGDWLFHEGDAADSMYVLVSGALEVIAESDGAGVMTVLGRGDAVGELALLTESVRSAGVRARRDTYLLKVTREAFEKLLAENFDFALAITRHLGRLLQGSRPAAVDFEPLPRVASLLPLGAGVDAAAFAHRLAEALRPFGSVAMLEEKDAEGAASESAFGGLLNRSEHDHERVLVVGGVPGAGSAWTRFAIRTGDRTVAIADGDANPTGAADPGLRGCDLVLLGGESSRASVRAWVPALDPRTIHVVRTDGEYAATVKRLARRLAAQSVGIVLSGGGARSFAHIGVVDELLRAGVTIDRFGGTSMGAYVAANFAAGRDAGEVERRCREEFVEHSVLNDYTLPVYGLLRSRKARAMLERTFGDTRIEELAHEFFCVSCDLVAAEAVIHRRGPLRSALGATMCLPAIFPPIPYQGSLLVDGGVLDNLPVGEMAERGEGPVIAVDVSAQFAPPSQRAETTTRRSRLSERSRELLTGWDPTPLPNVKETLIRSMLLGSLDPAGAVQRGADLVIAPETGPIPLTAFKRIDELVAAGRAAAREALARAPAGLGALNSQGNAPGA
jgi:NTE family protein